MLFFQFHCISHQGTIFGFHVQGIFKVPLLLVRLETRSRNLHKIDKNTTVSVLRMINIQIVIYLDNMLIMGQKMEEILMSRDTVIFLMQHLGFFLNMEKSILNPVQEIDFLGVTTNSLKMCLSLPQEKVLKIQSQYQDVYAKGQVTRQFRN